MNFHAALLFLVALAATSSATPWQPFDAINLNGENVSSQELIGQPTVLILTPSQDAATSTERWADSLSAHIGDSEALIRCVVTMKLPFFLSADDVLDRAQDKVASRYHGMTWLLESTSFDRSLGVKPDSSTTCVALLDSTGNLVYRIHGAPSKRNIRQLLTNLEAIESNSINS